jgi:adenylate kinase family enzyme
VIGEGRGKKLHVTGASGSGVTTLGKALAQEFGSMHLDIDDYFWLPTDPPYTTKRLRELRLALLSDEFARISSTGWVLSGSILGWGDSLISLFDMAIFISTPTELRLQRLQKREAARFGAEAIARGGSRHEAYEAFIKWAAAYEVLHHEGRSRARHEALIAQLPCPVLQLDGSLPISTLVQQVVSQLCSVSV